jgi:hypothetical protein
MPAQIANLTKSRTFNQAYFHFQIAGTKRFIPGDKLTSGSFKQKKLNSFIQTMTSMGRNQIFLIAINTKGLNNEALELKKNGDLQQNSERLS